MYTLLKNGFCELLQLRKITLQLLILKKLVAEGDVNIGE